MPFLREMPPWTVFKEGYFFTRLSVNNVYAECRQSLSHYVAHTDDCGEVIMSEHKTMKEAMRTAELRLLAMGYTVKERT